MVTLNAKGNNWGAELIHYNMKIKYIKGIKTVKIYQP